MLQTLCVGTPVDVITAPGGAAPLLPPKKRRFGASLAPSTPPLWETPCRPPSTSRRQTGAVGHLFGPFATCPAPATAPPTPAPFPTTNFRPTLDLSRVHSSRPTQKLYQHTHLGQEKHTSRLLSTPHKLWCRGSTPCGRTSPHHPPRYTTTSFRAHFGARGGPPGGPRGRPQPQPSRQQPSATL